MKDWTGNTASARACLGINKSYNTDGREENDFYATDPKAMEELLKVVEFAPDIWEPSCGQGHLAKILTAHGYNVKATDLIDRGYGQGGIDFFRWREPWHGDIITNPPYKFATEYARHALELMDQGRQLALFLKITYLEGVSRWELFKHQPPKAVYVAVKRIECGRNGKFVGGVWRPTHGLYGKRVTPANRS